MGYPSTIDDGLIKDLPDSIRLRIAEKLDTTQKPNWKTLITKMPNNMYDERSILRFHMAILKPRGSPTLQLLADLGRKKKTVQQLVTWLEQIENFSELVYFLKHGEEAFKELAPKIERQPDSVSCPVGGSLALEIEASGIPPLKYQWYKGNYELRNQTTNVLRIDNVIMFDGSYYACRVSNPYNFVYTNWCKVNVLQQDILSISSSFSFNAFNTPVVTLNPRSSCVQQGADLHLYADAVGWPSPTLQWFHNDQAILGECCRELIIQKVTKENQGFYHIEAANKHTSINSVKAEITVLDKSMTNSILSSIQTDYNTVESKSRSIQKENVCFIRGPEGPDVDPSSSMLPPASPTAKIGLIIGNQKYEHEEKLGPLVHPVNDAHDIAAELRSLDFKVVSLINLNLVDMRNAVKFFISLLDSGTYGLFYFAGHGFEIEGESYLMATDATSNYRPEENLSLSEILSPMTSRNPKLSVLLIDSCRTEPQLCCQNPISIKSSNQNALQRKNVTIGYGCCSRGRVLESPLMKNGYFAHHLMENIGRNVKIDDVLFNVAKGIHEDRIIDPATGRTQVVYRHSTVVNDLRLTDKVTATNQHSNELLSWQYAHIAPVSLVTVLENDHVKVQLVFTPEFSNCLLIQSKIIEKVKCKSRKVLFFLPQCIGGAIVETIVPEQNEKGVRLNDKIVRISNIERLDGDIDIHLEVSYDVNGLQYRQLAFYCIKEKPLYAKISERMKKMKIK